MADRFREDPAAFLRELFAVAVKAAKAEGSLTAHLPNRPKGRLIVLGAGKAAAAMAAVAEQHYGPDVEGIVVVPDGYARACRNIDVMEASHPVPDERGVEAARRILSLAREAEAEDLVLCLLSGGASAVMAAPAPGVSLEDKRSITAALLCAGATISEINCVRKHLSAVKGGRLAETAAPARVVCLTISDVVGDDCGIIGSGPTVPDRSTCGDALAVLRKFSVKVPEGVKGLLVEGLLETPKHLSAEVSTKVIVCARDALASASAFARSAGLHVIDLGDAWEGEARTFAQVQAMFVRRIRAGDDAARPPCLIISGGELTVRVDGGGRGGPNTEFALALALALDGLDSVWAIACDTDGRDGSTGAAGAVVGPETLQRLRAAGISAEKALKCNDSAGVFAALGDLVDPGPTFTNVNDFRAILVLPKGLWR
jgi:glycerate 2-kinase